MPENTITVALEIKNQKVKGDLEKVIASIGGFKTQPFNASSEYDLLILEMEDEPGKGFNLIQSIHTSGQVKEIFLTSPHLDPDLLIRALRGGVKEFFHQPIKSEEVKNALSKFKDQMRAQQKAEKKHRGKIINVIGSKGGVGTTTIAVNLATSLIESSKSSSPVALIDMNLLFGEIPLFLNLQSNFNWAELAKNITRLDSTYLMGILSKHQSGLYVLPSPTGLDGMNVATPEIIERILDQMKDIFDFIVIDGGQSLDDISLKIMEISDFVLLISILSLPCLANLKKLLWTFQKLGFPRQENSKIILNRYMKKSLISLKEAEQALNQKIFWLVPNDYQTTMSAINQGKSLAAVDRGAEITRNFRELSSKFLEIVKN
jgi:pilus assembly protein CpaE